MLHIGTIDILDILNYQEALLINSPGSLEYLLGLPAPYLDKEKDYFTITALTRKFSNTKPIAPEFCSHLPTLYTEDLYHLLADLKKALQGDPYKSAGCETQSVCKGGNRISKIGKHLRNSKDPDKGLKKGYEKSDGTFGADDHGMAQRPQCDIKNPCNKNKQGQQD